jgi:hypothetical protein
MHAAIDPAGEVRKMALARLADLEVKLVAHGFSVEVEAKFWALTATSPADMRGPRRSQRVQLAADHAERLHWYRKRSEGDDVEQLCPGDEVAEVGEVIARALNGPADDRRAVSARLHGRMGHRLSRVGRPVRLLGRRAPRQRSDRVDPGPLPAGDAAR